MTFMEDKSSLREYFLELLKRQGAQDRQNKSRKIAEQLFSLPSFQRARTVLFYASMPGEVDTLAMMKQAMQSHKHIALPVLATDQRQMIPTLINSLDKLNSGPYGVLQPALDPANALKANVIDAVIVPGLAFDKALHRLGRGAGYYDRFLSTLPSTVTKVGIGFDFQIVDCLPVEEHDVPLDAVIAG